MERVLCDNCSSSFISSFDPSSSITLFSRAALMSTCNIRVCFLDALSRQVKLGEVHVSTLLPLKSLQILRGRSGPWSRALPLNSSQLYRLTPFSILAFFQIASWNLPVKWISPWRRLWCTWKPVYREAKMPRSWEYSVMMWWIFHSRNIFSERCAH